MQLPKHFLLAASIVSFLLLIGPCQNSHAQDQSESRGAAQRAFGEGQRLLAEGTVNSQLKAIDEFSRASSLWQAVNDQRMEAISLSYVGKLYDLLGEKHKALDYYNRTASLLHTAGDLSGEATTLNNIGLIYDSLGDKQKALDYYNQALPALRTVGNRAVEAITLVNVGLAYASLGEKQKALDYYNEALPILRAVGDRGDEAVTLNNIGYVYDSLGDKQKALDYFGRALPLLQEVGNTRAAAITLNNIGYAYDSMEERQKALDYYNLALPVFRTVGDRRMEAFTLNNLGVTYRSQGQKAKALDYFTQALALRRSVADRPGQAATLNDIGSIYDLMDQPLKALDYYREALTLSRAVEDREIEASSLHKIARIQRNRGQLVEARTDIEAALAIVEGLRTKIAGQELRASYFASTRQYYEFYIDLLLRLDRLEPHRDYDVLAFQASERARARSLLEVLTEARANIRQGVDPSLLEQERALQQKLNGTAERQARLRSEGKNQQQADTLKQETESLLTQYQEVQAQIRARSPKYAALTQQSQVSLEEIQQQALDPETLLLEYALGDEKSFLFAVTPASIKSFELPPRAEIEAVARRTYDLLTARNQRIKFETAAEQRARIAKSDVDYWQSAAKLSRMLLGPVASLLGNKRLLIVADGALNYVPFAAWPTPEDPVAEVRSSASTRDKRPDRANSRAQTDPLILNHEIVNLPSASTLALLRRDLRERKAAPKTLAVLADPVFEKDDERVRSTKTTLPASLKQKSTPTQNTLLVEAAAKQDPTGEDKRIQRLPYTRLEADQILALVSHSDSLKALDFAANRATATNPTLGQYRYVHFATHGVLNSAHPELSALVLSLVDEHGTEQDGFLWAHDVYNLQLPVEMVVLSGCRTGLGKEIKGEGLVGLTRGFMYAGSARVLVSLWDVADEASAALMTRVYKGILGAPRLRPAAALREGQISIWKERRWQAPYYWAAFVLQGEPR